MLNYNATCTVQVQNGFDVYGQAAWGIPVTERCAIVRLKPQMQHTTVRADGSMSRGHGDEATLGFCKVLMDSTTIARLGALVGLKVGVVDVLFKVTAMEPRLSVTGVVDHYEVEGEQCPS